MRKDEEEEQDYDLSYTEARNNYKIASEVANKVLAALISQTKPGKKILELCNLGDTMIQNELNAVLSDDVDKGIAFPTCISVNNCAGHYSPLNSDPVLNINEGDLVKIDLGVHVDGYTSVGAHTVVARSNQQQPTTGRQADVICAAHFAAQCALALMRPGRKNTEVTQVIEKVAEVFHCKPLEGVLSHQMKRYLIDGNNCILSHSNFETKVEEFTFQENEVYGLDIVMSTGEGKAKEGGVRTTIFKRAHDQNYLLKLKTARYVLSEINSKHSAFPFTLRVLDEKRARFGIVECLTHGLVNPYPVLFEKPGEFIAQFKFTVFLLPTTVKGINQPLPFVQSQYSLTDPDLLKLYNEASSTSAPAAAAPKAAKKKNKKKKKKAAPKAEDCAMTD